MKPELAVFGLVIASALRAAPAEGLTTVIAIDCEVAPAIGREFRGLEPGPAVNAGQIAFADANGVYRYDLDTGALTVIAQLGDRPTCSDGTLGDWLVSFGPHIRINESGMVGWIGETRVTCPDDLAPTRVCFQPDPVDDCSAEGSALAAFRWDGTTTTRVSCCPLGEVQGHDFAIDGNGAIVFVSREPAGCDPGDRVERLVRADAGSMTFLFSAGDVLPSGHTLGCFGDEPVFGGVGIRRTGTTMLFHARVTPPAAAGGCCLPLLALGSGTPLFECGEPTFDGRFIVPRWETKPSVGRMWGGDCPLGPCRAALTLIDDVGCNGKAPVEAIVQNDGEVGSLTIVVETDRPYDELGGRVLCDLTSDASDTPGVIDAPGTGNLQGAFAGHYGTPECCGAGGAIPAIFVYGAGPTRRRVVLVEEGDRAPSPHDDRRYVAFGPPVVVHPRSVEQVVFWAATTDRHGQVLGGIFAVPIPPRMCGPDLSRNGIVDVADILEVLDTWSDACAPADLDGSGSVDIGDILAVLAAWGPCE